MKIKLKEKMYFYNTTRFLSFSVSYLVGFDGVTVLSKIQFIDVLCMGVVTVIPTYLNI